MLARPLVLQNSDENFELDGERRPAKRTSHQPGAEIPTTFIDFRSSPRFVRVPQGETLIPRGKPKQTPTNGESKVKIKRTDQTVSADEPLFGGMIQPIEFAGLEMSKSKDENGLSKFLQAIRYLKVDYPQLIIEYTIVDVLGDKPFCLANGVRRTCAIVEVSHPDLLPCYIFEFARPDKWSISTLFVRIVPQNSDLALIENKAQSILANAISGNGHWGTERLIEDESFKLLLLKHTATNSNWSARIMEKLKTFGFAIADNSE